MRKSLAASLVEICRLIGLKDENDENDDRTFMVEVANHLLADVDEIKLNILPNLCEFVSLFPEDNQRMLLNSMIRERLVSFLNLFNWSIFHVARRKMSLAGRHARSASRCWCSFLKSLNLASWSRPVFISISTMQLSLNK